MTPIERLRELVVNEREIDPPPLDFLLFEVDGDRGTEVGILYPDPEMESYDAHCAECREEILVFGCRVDEPALSRYLAGAVSPTKFARIRAGWRESIGLDLRKVRFVE